MNSAQPKHESWLYGLAFLIAIGLRFIQLGASPLTDSEATLALQAHNLASGESPLLSPHAAYILLTSVLFAIAESTNFLARFLPALAGSLLVLTPRNFRAELTPRVALILSFLLAFDPGMVALSRQANGTMLALTSLVWTWSLLKDSRLIPAGISAALTLLSGPSTWSGFLTLLLTRLFLRATKDKDTQASSIEDQSPISSFQSLLSNYRPFLTSLAVSLTLLGTLFFLVPSGLSAGLASIPAYVSGWVTETSTTPSRILFTFIAYEPLGIFLAVLACIRAFRTRSPRLMGLLMWFAVALLLAVFYRQPSELVWVIVPLLILASLELAHIHLRSDERSEVGITVAVLGLLLVFSWINFPTVANDPMRVVLQTSIGSTPINILAYYITVATLTLVAITVVFVNFGWSRRVARASSVWAFTLILGIYSFGAAWGTSGLRNLNGRELWSADSNPRQADLLLASVEEVSKYSLGHAASQPVTIFAVTSPALEWTLRNHNVEIVSVLDPQVAPPIVVTPLMNDLALPAAYRGQDFTWRQTPPWELVQGADWLKWLVFRQLPQDNETIILWARNDLFPDARESVQP